MSGKRKTAGGTDGLSPAPAEGSLDKALAMMSAAAGLLEAEAGEDERGAALRLVAGELRERVGQLERYR